MPRDNEALSQPEKGKVRIILGPSSFIAIIFVGLVAISLAYVGGVMSGRHFTTETVTVQASNPETQEQADNNPKEILAAEELNFAHVLRKEQPDKTPQAPVISQAQTAPAKAQEPAKTEGMDAATENSAAATPPPLDTVTLYDYIFQIAAFKDENAADTLRQKLEGYGFRTVLDRSGKMLIVLLRLRGTEAKAAEINQISSQLHLGAPILRSRKLVP